MGEMYRNGKYLAAGRWYPEADLYGYPDSLIRGRTSFAYKAGCDLILNNSAHKPQRVGDIGSCHGHGVVAIQEILQPKEVFSLDRWYDFLYAQGRVIKPTPHLIEMNLPHLPINDDSFDSIFLMHVIEHLDNPSKHLQEINRILKPGGSLIIATPDEHNVVWHNPDDEQLYSKSTLTEIMAEAGFNPEVYSIAGNDHAMAVHHRKRNIAHYFPYSQKLRKHVAWKTWDKLLLAGGLDHSDFYLETKAGQSNIDLLALGKK